MSDDEQFLRKAIQISQESVAAGGFPVGAIVVQGETIIGAGISDGKQKNDATSHAEIDAIRNASQSVGKRNLTGTTLYTSMEPCLMCFSACYWAKIDKIVYAVPKTKLAPEHYEGLHDLARINKTNNRQMTLVHIPALEQEGLTVIRAWEQRILV